MKANREMFNRVERRILGMTAVAFTAVIAFGANTDQLLTDKPVQAAVSEYLAAKPAVEARGELLAALETEERFAPGQPARDRAVIALASLSDEEGRPLLGDPRQVDVLVTAALDRSLGTAARVHVVERLPMMASIAPALVEVAFEQLLETEDPYVLGTALHGMTYWDGLDEKFSPTLLGIATDPASIVPEAWRIAEAEVARERAEWGQLANESGLTDRIRKSAASAWLLSEDAGAALRVLKSAEVKVPDVWASGLLNAMLVDQAPFWAADTTVQIDTLALLGDLLIRPEALPTARCCAASVLLRVAARSPELTDDAALTVEQIIEAHGDDGTVRRNAVPALEMIERLKAQRAANASE
jgi:hypothetical protein